MSFPCLHYDKKATYNKQNNNQAAVNILTQIHVQLKCIQTVHKHTIIKTRNA